MSRSGLIIMIMAWDHGKDVLWNNVYYGQTAVDAGFQAWSGHLATYEGRVDIFVARFISHFCAPGFFFTMGIGMSLFTASRRRRGLSLSLCALSNSLHSVWLCLWTPRGARRHQTGAPQRTARGSAAAANTIHARHAKGTKYTCMPRTAAEALLHTHSPTRHSHTTPHTLRWLALPAPC